MKKLLLSFLLISQFAIAQDNDTISWVLKLNDFIVSATRSKAKINELPIRISVLNDDLISKHPSLNFDDILQSIPNVYVNRSAGIFSKNSSVTMRGMDGTNRVLVLYDGIPLNKASGGGINWHIVDEDAVGRVEVTKGSNSALFGANSMAGTISIFTKLPEKPFDIKAYSSIGSMNSQTAKLNFSSNKVKNNKGWYWTANSFYRRGDGYYFVQEAERDSNDSKLYLSEVGANFKAGYIFSTTSKIAFSYNLYTDKRGDGITIFEENGGYLKDFSNLFSIDFEHKLRKWDLIFKGFCHFDTYNQHTERLNSTGDTYKLYDVLQKSKDAGFLSGFTRTLSKQRITTGIDFKYGDLFASDIYRTSTDEIIRSASMNFLAIYFQDEIFISKKWNFIGGIRFEISSFYNGQLEVKNPTATTGFEDSFSEIFSNSNWINLSPKLAFKYKKSSKLDFFFSFSHGFIPPKLDDMVSSRKISKGFKLANPLLKPEFSNNFEIGLNYKPIQRLEYEVSTYYTFGKDFQYFIQTGDTLEDNALVFKRINVGKVEIIGLETELRYAINQHFFLKANYTYNYSIVKEFNGIGEGGYSLQGKFISETPSHQWYAGFIYKNKIANISMAFNYIGDQWGDELNTFSLNHYYTFDIKMFRPIKKHFDVVLQIQNLLDNKYVDKKNGVSPGRFIEFAVIWKLK